LLGSLPVLFSPDGGNTESREHAQQDGSGGAALPAQSRRPRSLVCRRFSSSRQFRRGAILSNSSNATENVNKPRSGFNMTANHAFTSFIHTAIAGSHPFASCSFNPGMQISARRSRGLVLGDLLRTKTEPQIGSRVCAVGTGHDDQVGSRVSSLDRDANALLVEGCWIHSPLTPLKVT
jgi:hypothetical protein